MAESRSNRAAVQATNDDASASKLSCVKKGYIKDDYVHLFVRRPVRRSPIINRGYFSRWAAFRKLLFQFLESSQTKKQILSLGAGFDTTYFQLLDEGKAPNLYVELDFKEVTSKKAAVIENSGQLRDKLGANASISIEDGQVLSEHYKLLPVDLRDIPKLRDVISFADMDPSLPTFIIAECVLIYLDPDSSRAIVNWASQAFSTSVFFLYEQIHPDDAFGHQMIRNLESRGCALLSIDASPTLLAKERLFLDNGWQVLIDAYGMYGEGEKALEAFTDMEKYGIVPDNVAFIAVIYACSHSGLVEEGLACFDKMKTRYKINPLIEHYACVVDLLSQSRKILKAEEFIEAMPIKPDAIIWASLLRACRTSGDMETVERVSKKIIELNPDDPGYSILASNAYAALRKWDKVSLIRKSLKDKRMKKNPGYSWIEIGKKVHVFCAGDDSAPQSEAIHKSLEVLYSLMDKEGYIPDSREVSQNLEDEEEKRRLICGHSERLAIAFGLLNTEPGTPLQVMKNLRVCGDCHEFTKLISKIVGREILVRDANRFHLFKDGICSCKDRW